MIDDMIESLTTTAEKNQLHIATFWQDRQSSPGSRLKSEDSFGISFEGRGRDRGEEIGDLLFTIVNLAARRGINGENALRRSALKCVERFRYMEKRLAEQGRQVEGTDLDELETLWQQSKARPTAGE